MVQNAGQNKEAAETDLDWGSGADFKPGKNGVCVYLGGTLFKALFVLLFFRAFRVSKLVGGKRGAVIKMEYIEWGPEGMGVWLQKIKMDQKGKGNTSEMLRGGVGVPNGTIR